MAETLANTIQMIDLQWALRELLARQGRPLDPAAQKKETERLNNLLRNSSEQSRQVSDRSSYTLSGTSSGVVALAKAPGSASASWNRTARQWRAGARRFDQGSIPRLCGAEYWSSQALRSTLIRGFGHDLVRMSNRLRRFVLEHFACKPAHRFR